MHRIPPWWSTVANFSVKPQIPGHLSKSSLTSLGHNKNPLSTSPEPGISSLQGLSDPTSVSSDMTLRHLPGDPEMNLSLVLRLGVADQAGGGPDLVAIRPSSPSGTVDSELDWDDWDDWEDRPPKPTLEAPVATPSDKPQHTSDELVQLDDPALTLSNRPTKRKLSFEQEQHMSDDRARMPPPPLRPNRRRSGHEGLNNFLKSGNLAKTKDEVFRINPATPSTPRFLEPVTPSPGLAGDTRKHCYPKITGFSNFLNRPVETPLPETYLDELRKTTDPFFSNDEFWADEFYFPDEAYAFRHFEDSRPRPSQRQDWSTIWRALQKQAGRIRVPTSADLTENVFHKLGNKMGRRTMEDLKKREAANLCHVEKIRPWFDNLGVAWSLARMDLPVESKIAEAVTGVPIADPDQMTRDEDFKEFGRSATFVAERALARPDPEDTASVFHYTRLPVASPVLDAAENLPQRQTPTLSPFMPLSESPHMCEFWPFPD